MNIGYKNNSYDIKIPISEPLVIKITVMLTRSSSVNIGYKNNKVISEVIMIPFSERLVINSDTDIAIDKNVLNESLNRYHIIKPSNL